MSQQILHRAIRRITPADRLARFLDGLIRSVPSEAGHAALSWLERREEVDPRVLLPMQARVAVSLLRDQGRSDALAEVLAQAIRLPGTLPTVLDLIADEAVRSMCVDSVGSEIAGMMDASRPGRANSFRGLGTPADRSTGGMTGSPPSIRLLFTTEIDRPDWEALRDRSPEPLRPWLAASCLEVASEPGAVSEAPLDGRRRRPPALRGRSADRSPVG